MTPGEPKNPDWIVADTDALIQLVITDNLSLLRSLKTEYSIQCLVVEAVESELLKVVGNKFPSFLGAVRKAFHNQVFVVMDSAFLSREMGDAIGANLYTRATQLGEKLYETVDRGEAYSHAAAMVLGVPILSHDIKAIQKLRGHGFALSRPLLRFFDIVALGLQTGGLTLSECDDARQELIRQREFVIQCFQRCSFEDGLKVFFVRLLDRNNQPVGATIPNQHNDERIWIEKV